MATTADLIGLFGQDPQALQQARDMQMAQLDPAQRLYMMGAQTGRSIGQGLGALFGVDVQDPMVKKATQLRALANEFDTTTAEGMMKFAQAAQQIDPRAGALAAQQAQAMAKSAADITKVNAEAAAKVQDVTGKQARIDTLVAAGVSPKEAEGIASSDTAFSNYIKGKKVETNNEQAAAARSLNIEAKPYLADYTPQEMTKILDKVQQNKVDVARASAQKPVDVAAIIKEIGTKEDIKAKADTWKQAGAAYTAQLPMIKKLDEVSAILPKTFTGSFSEAQLQVGKALSALGVPVDEKKLANTEYVNSVSAQVLQTIARSFPGSLAVKEMEQLVKSKFNSRQQLESMTRIIRDLRTEIQAGALSYEQLSKLPEADRYSKDMNFVTGQNFKKLSRLNTLVDKAETGTITKAEREEAMKLQQELK